MLGGLLNSLTLFVLQTIGAIFDGLLSPIINVILDLFPDISSVAYYIITWLNYAFTYLQCAYRWLLFQSGMFEMLFLYWFAKYAIFVISASIRLAVNIYNKLKP